MKNRYPKAVSRVAWWYFLTTFNLYIGVFDLLPDWLGYILLCMAIEGMFTVQPTAELLHIPAAILAVYTVVNTMFTAVGGELPYPVSAVFYAIYLYVHYQVCTNIYDTVKLLGTEKGQKIALHRDITTVTYTALMLAQNFMRTSVVFYGIMVIHIVSKIALIAALCGHSSQREAQMTEAENVYTNP